MSNLNQWVPKRSSISDEPKLLALKKSFGELLGTALWSRGFEPEASLQIEKFLNPKLEQLTPPWALKNMELVVDRLVKALHNHERICVYADYDMDGMSGLCLLKSFLESCGFKDVMTYQPDRFDEGYGVHPAALVEIANKGAQIVISVDTGTTAHEAALKCQDLGVDFIITDHHQQVGELPCTPYIINPNQREDSSELNYLSGAGVAFYLCMALRQRLRETHYFNESVPEPDLRNWLDIYCLGTIGDVVDLVSCNRVLVRIGLSYLARTQRPGLKELIARVLSPETIPVLSARDIAFSVIPKLNAASRMGKAYLSTQLLMCEDENEASKLVDEILTLNTLRSDTQSKILKEATAQADSMLQSNPHLSILCLSGTDWHEGVLGIVAAKITESYDRPAIILTQTHDNKLRGSMRSRGEAHCVKILEGASEFLERFGGHKAAAGMQLQIQNLEAFRSALDQTMKQFYLQTDQPLPSTQTLFDGELSIQSELSILEIKKMLSLEPFGAGNPEPLFLLRQVPSSIFELLKESHIKAKRYLGTDMIGFQQATQLTRIKASGVKFVDLLVTPEINTFRNQSQVQLKIKHLREAIFS